MTDLGPIKSKIEPADFVSAITSPEFEEALAIVRANSKPGKIWAVGGAVFRSVTAAMYERKKTARYDFDFIVQDMVPFEEVKLPAGWQLTETGLGAPRAISGNRQIDLWPLDDSCREQDRERLGQMNREENLESYFAKVPLTVQMVAYDIDEKRLIGERGIQAVRDQLIEINCLDECLSFCKRRRISIREFMTQKATALGFQVVPPIFPDAAKIETVAYYDTHVDAYQNNRSEDYHTFIERYLANEAGLFIRQLQGPRVLDLAAGAGRDALWMQSQGLKPLCVDLSAAMVSICRAKGLEALQMDMEDIDLPNGSFDGVWAYAALLHIPKHRVDNVVARVSELLKPSGVFFVGMLAGQGEEMMGKRLFALYQDEEIEELLARYFQIISFKKITTSTGKTWLNYLCKKR
jgi:2-polyprenyl-3-methyl-5-hydroxy-6-metoxy-1,4-benzoquinol methylase